MTAAAKPIADPDTLLASARSVLEREGAALLQMAGALPADFAPAAEAILAELASPQARRPNR